MEDIKRKEWVMTIENKIGPQDRRDGGRPVTVPLLRAPVLVPTSQEQEQESIFSSPKPLEKCVAAGFLLEALLLDNEGSPGLCQLSNAFSSNRLSLRCPILYPFGTRSSRYPPDPSLIWREAEAPTICFWSLYVASRQATWAFRNRGILVVFKI